jgi:CDP-diacylglycerol--glycerol-3-phosphate 3-phosphatidyltransferase/cardiolipin synthase
MIQSMRRMSARPAALPSDFATLRTLADQAFNRAAGAPLIGGNRVQVLQDGAENYPAWERAIASARSTIHVEMYIVHNDLTGRRFVDLLAERARAGVTVRLVYDWFGCGWGPWFGLFKPLVAAGGQVRAFNPPTFVAMLSWTRRNHRKLITVDNRVAFVSGLCVGNMWVGDASHPPWRDTGLQIEGPAVAHLERAFYDSWQLAGGDMAPVRRPDLGKIAPAGSVSLRIIATEPFTASMLRIDLLVAAMARKTLWITDAYFIGHGPYIEALRRASHDGVDVRLLMPRDSDVGWTVPVSRTMYRTMLEAGVRLFEWNGSMVHAKTAVADSRWSRIGSTNLNVNSWLGNWELDIAIDDAGVAETLEERFLQDLEHSTEFVLGGDQRPPRRPRLPARAAARRSARRVVRTVTGVGRSLSAAVTGSRTLEDFESFPVFLIGIIFAIVAVVAVLQPPLVAWPLGALTAWAALSLIIEAVRLWRQRKRS